MPHGLTTKRFWSYINKNGPIYIQGEHLEMIGTRCWLWTGRVNKQGYGLYSTNLKVHRLVLKLIGFTVPLYKDVHHKCNNRSCCNPSHLEVTGFEHRGKYHREITHCPHGHEYTFENTYIDLYGYRQCRACNRENYQRRKHAQLP